MDTNPVKGSLPAFCLIVSQILSLYIDHGVTERGSIVIDVCTVSLMAAPFPGLQIITMTIE